jgi:hypothetical protein
LRPLSRHRLPRTCRRPWRRSKASNNHNVASLPMRARTAPVTDVDLPARCLGNDTTLFCRRKNSRSFAVRSGSSKQGQRLEAARNPDVESCATVLEQSDGLECTAIRDPGQVRSSTSGPLCGSANRWMAEASGCNPPLSDIRQARRQSPTLLPNRRRLLTKACQLPNLTTRKSEQWQKLALKSR